MYPCTVFVALKKQPIKGDMWWKVSSCKVTIQRTSSMTGDLWLDRWWSLWQNGTMGFEGEIIRLTVIESWSRLCRISKKIRIPSTTIHQDRVAPWVDQVLDRSSNLFATTCLVSASGGTTRFCKSTIEAQLEAALRTVIAGGLCPQERTFGETLGGNGYAALSVQFGSDGLFLTGATSSKVWTTCSQASSQTERQHNYY